MSPRRRTATVAIVGALVLGAGALTLLLGLSRADDAAADLEATTDAEAASRQDAVASRDLDRRIHEALADARLSATAIDPAVRRALEDSRTHRQRLGEIVANAERSVSTMRANDGDAYNATLDRHNELNELNELNEKREEIWRAVNDSTSRVSEQLAQVYAAYDEALLAADR